MGEVVVLNGPTRLPLPVERVCDGAKDQAHVLILSWDKAGEFRAATNDGSSGPVLADMAQRFLAKYYRGDYDE